jgi:3-hydroxyacyl-CoA dehydrogenase
MNSKNSKNFMKRTIKKVAILGSGVMGSRIACHFANIGVQVLLLDIVPKEPTEDEKKKGLSLSDKAVRNRLVNNALDSTLKAKPASLYDASYVSRISTGNFDDDLPKDQRLRLGH